MKRKINPLVLAMLIAISSAILFKILDLSNKTTDQYIWVHYNRDGVTILSAGMINSLKKSKKDIHCIEQE